MTLRTIVYDRCIGHAGTAALIGTRCYPDRLPENAIYPALVYKSPISADNAPFRSHDGGPTAFEVVRVQFDCYDATGDGAAALADQLRLAWDGHTDGCIVAVAWQANRTMTRADALDAYRVIVDVMVEYGI